MIAVRQVRQVEAEELGEDRPFVEGADHDDVAAVPGGIDEGVGLQVAVDVHRLRQIDRVERRVGAHVELQVGGAVGEERAHLRANLRSQVGGGVSELLRLPGAHQPRGIGHRRFQRLPREEDQADLQDREKEPEEGDGEQAELDGRGAAHVAAEAAARQAEAQPAEQPVDGEAKHHAKPDSSMVRR